MCKKSLALACRYLSCMAEELSEMVSEACFSARAAFCSPSAAITWGRRRIETLEKVEFVNASCLSLFMRVWCLAGLDLVLLGLAWDCALLYWAFSVPILNLQTSKQTD